MILSEEEEFKILHLIGRCAVTKMSTNAIKSCKILKIEYRKIDLLILSLPRYM